MIMMPLDMLQVIAEEIESEKKFAERQKVKRKLWDKLIEGMMS